MEWPAYNHTSAFSTKPSIIGLACQDSSTASSVEQPYAIKVPRTTKNHSCLAYPISFHNCAPELDVSNKCLAKCFQEVHADFFLSRIAWRKNSCLQQLQASCYLRRRASILCCSHFSMMNKNANPMKRPRGKSTTVATGNPSLPIGARPVWF